MKEKKQQKKKINVLYLTHKLGLGKTQQLDELALAAGYLYTMILVWFWRTYRKKDIWLSKNSMEIWWKIDKWNRLHSHTADAICDTFYEALLGWSHAKKQGCTHIHPPKHKKKYFKIPYKSSAISIVDGLL